MGRNFISKLGNLLRVFKVGKKRGSEKDQEDLVEITSESGVRSYDSSSHQEPSEINRNLILKKSKSIESLATGTFDSGSSKINELKRSNGTCDIFSNKKEDDVKCTKSLHRFGQLTRTNNCVFSYNAKLHDGTIWSQALGRVAKRTTSTKSESTSSSVIQVDSANLQEDRVSVASNNIQTNTIDATVDKQEWKSDKSTIAKAEYPRIEEKYPEAPPLTDWNTKESSVKVSVSSNTQTPQDTVEIHPEFCDSSSKSKIIDEIPHLQPPVQIVEQRMVQVLEQTPLKASQPIPLKDSEPESSGIEEQKIQVKMDVETVKNEQGFDLLKYDLKSSGDHVNDLPFRPTKSMEVIKQTIQEEKPIRPVDSSTVFSENTTEYEVVNLAQVDLFREFKTTISKMRNVLNVLEVKKSLQRVIERSFSEKMIRKSTTDVLEAENISTQTAEMTFNQISTSTDVCCNETRNESIMVQLSSETTSKRITLDSNLLHHIKPLNKIKRRKKRGYRCKYKRGSTKVISNLSSSQDGKVQSKMKPDKPHYNKCIIYHITQHKNAVDRCVGTPCSATKEKLVLKNTFSALHFGPINEFPMLLNKHENEYRKKKDMEQKLKGITSENDQKCNHRRRSTSFLSSEASKITNQNSCHRSKTQPSLNYATSKDYSSLSNSTTTANWFVFDPSPPVVVKEKQSTSDDIILDKNRSSTQELVSNILEEEFKTSGLKGRISSGTMNMIKDQFCDKLNGVKNKDAPDVMITVCVPLKSIVSKIKTKKTGCKVVSSAESANSTKKLPCFFYDRSIQVNVSPNNVNDNLQTIPEKICRKSSEIYQQNKMLRESMSSKRLSTFKKIFGNKATSCSNINPFGHLAPRTSRIYFSDHSTSSPDFVPKPSSSEAVHFANKKILTTPKSSSLSLFCQGSRSKREGFFLNLPPNRYRRKREQISRLFDDSDSSDRKYFGEPQLLYHVHESSFYSTSKTDDRFSSRRILPKSSASHEKSKVSFFPVQENASRVNINMKPKYVSFSDLPKRYDEELPTPVKPPEAPTKDQRCSAVPPKPTLKNADVNTSNEKVFRDIETQCETELCPLPQVFQDDTKTMKKKTRKLIETESFFNDCIDEFSIVSLPKVHFEDEVPKGMDVEKPNEILDNSEMHKCEIKSEEVEIDKGKTQRTESILSLFAEDDKYPKKTTENVVQEKVQDVQTEECKEIEPKQHRRSRHKKQVHTILQTSSESIVNPLDQEEFGTQPEIEETNRSPDRKHKRKRSRDIVRVESTQVDSITSLPRKENCLVQVESPKNTRNESRLTGLIRDVVNLCNSSFMKSRDCIVELTLYNLIKEIILEHCSHLSEQSRQKVESILANFITVSKQKSGNEDVEIVESAIENLVKEISTELPDDLHETKEVREDLDEEYVRERRDEHEHRHRRKHSRSKSKHRGHKHESKHRSRHRETDGEHREKHRHKDEEKKYKSKKHKHHCNNESRCDMGKKHSETKFRSVDGKREYLELVQRLKELEEVTKQLSNVAQNQPPTQCLQLEETEHKHAILDKPKMFSKRRMKFSLTELEKLGKKYPKDPIKVNFFQTETENPVVPIPRNTPKLPVTKIVINLSNLKLLTRNCVSMTSTSAREPIVITDSTEEKQKLINEIVSYQIDNGFRSRVRHSSRHLEKNLTKDARSGIVNKNKESVTITIHGKDKRKKQHTREGQAKMSKASKDFMRIKMVRRKKTVTSTSEHTGSDSYSSRMNPGMDYTNDIHHITKEYIKKEYKLSSDQLCASIAKDILENKCNLNQILDNKGNLDIAYQRMANYCLFRGLLRKE